jgi:hypothetical protein
MTDHIHDMDKLSEWEKKRFDEIFLLVQHLIAHPHETITEHDKHRALVLISFVSRHDDLVEYLYSQMTQDDYDKTKKIRKDVLDSTKHL